MTQHEAPAVQLGATPGKLALIAVLGIVLVSVIVMQFVRVTRRQLKGTRRPQPKSNPRTPSHDCRTRGTTTSKTGITRKRVWPVVTLSEIAGHNPFELPLRFQRTTAPTATQTASPGGSDQAAHQRARDELLKTLHEVGVSLIIDSGGERVAYVGDFTLRVGQVIHDFRVVDIRPDGVLLEDSGGQ